jgi:membrane fusion protein, multidrug efflux system
MLKSTFTAIVLLTAIAPAFAELSTPVQLQTAAVQSSGTADSASFDGVVEAVRQTQVAAQVPGAVIALEVRAGDTVKAGQILLRIDARTADQNTAASDAQVAVARSSLDMATREVERQRQLFEQRYISQAALDRAEAQFRTTTAQVRAQLAQAGAARTQSGLHVVKAPYSGVIAEVPVALGDMAMPGRPLLTIYDPSALRVTVAVPQSALVRRAAEQKVRLELPGLPGTQKWQAPARVQVLPTIDAGTHTAQLRLDLAPGTEGISPGMFARVWLPMQDAGTTRLSVPLQAVVKRAEMTGLYVLNPQGRPLLRQVRLGRAGEESVEVLSGVEAGELVALDPQAAARMR